MYSSYQYNKELEDDLYREDDSDGSEPDSELEFHLYSQLHYSSNAGEVSELEDKGKEINESPQDDQKMSDGGVLGQLSENRSPTQKTESVEIEKKLKRTKTAKTKEKPSFHRPLSAFEEVIVIDSGPEVVTLSEENSSNDDEKEGVCLVKGQRLPKRCASTPILEARKRMTNAADPVNVTSSESESESESDCQYVSDSSSSSDSEHLESWMILGHEEHEGDQSISLNLDGVTDSDTDDEEHGDQWVISDKDRKAQISNKDRSVRAVVQRVTSRYYTDKNVHCRNCNRIGHLSKNCPEPKKCVPCCLCATVGHRMSECPYKYCGNCGLPGHHYSSCSERPPWHKKCYRCGMMGHFLDACPEIWRQYHITIKIGPPIKHQGRDQGRTPAYCYNCSYKGHFGHQCTRSRMFNGTFATTPFINQYDTIEDIKGRQQRIKTKVKNLKNRHNQPVFQSPSTSGPPRKKQKVNDDKKSQITDDKKSQITDDKRSQITDDKNSQITDDKRSHQYTPRQSYKSDLPASKHIIFDETSDSVSKSNESKYFKAVSLEKPWKPKRPVPRQRDSAPNAVVVVDEDDFPRGGGQGEEVEKRKKSKKMKNGQSLCWTKAGRQSSFSECAKDKSNKQRKKAKKNAFKKKADKTYPTDENLFIIKQRKHKRY